MKLSHQWLREWVSPRLDARALAERLTLAGLEVVAIETVAPPLNHVVVGRVRSTSPHPKAGHLTLCVVEMGSGKTLQIVCGAPNVVVGMKAALALPGAVLAGGRRVEAAAIHGIGSAGMLCSAAELGLGESSAGLLVLDPSARAGAPLGDALQLDDVTLELELTPNRGDCLSVAGVAREIAALTGAPLRGPAARKNRVKAPRRVVVKLFAKAECPHYAGRTVLNLRPGIATPSWIQERLRRTGMRSLHPIVDVTNYVMLELGQPMHAFDLGKLRGAVQVRKARQGESLTLLDGRALTTPAGSLLIADDRGPIALAGIMGGQDTAVGGETRDVFLESAFFTPETIALHARSLGIQTESSQRFERGVDPELQVRALERATELLVGIGGGNPGPITDVKGPRRASATVALRHARLERLVGCAVPAKTVERALTGLGMKVRRTAGGWRVAPPSYRFDIRIEPDLIEETVRLFGYSNVPARMPRISLVAPDVPEARLEPRRLSALLVDRDYQEVVTYSFVDPDLQKLIDPSNTPMMLANPISADMSVMRTTLWPSLLQALQYNRNRQLERVRLFETGRRYLSAEGEPTEEAVLAGVASGNAAAKQWGVVKREVDFYDVKGDVEALSALSGYWGEFRFLAANHPALHPGQSAAIHVGGEQIGWMGVLHPSLQSRLDLGPAVLFELKLNLLAQRRVPAFTEVSRFPAIRRDLAIVVSEEISGHKVVEAIRGVAGNLLVDLQLFDVYRGERIDSGRKSFTLTLTFQHSSRTLREAEVDALMAQVISTLAGEVGAELRR